MRHYRSEHRDIYESSLIHSSELLNSSQFQSRQIQQAVSDQIDHIMEGDDCVRDEVLGEDVSRNFDPQEAVEMETESEDETAAPLDEFELEERFNVWKRNTARDAMSFKSHGGVSQTVANRIAYGAVMSFIDGLQHSFGLKRNQYEKCIEIANIFRSTKVQQKYTRLPITYKPIFAVNTRGRTASRPLLHVSMLDTLRELFKIEEVREAIYADAQSKFLFWYFIKRFNTFFRCLAHRSIDIVTTNIHVFQRWTQLFA